MLVCGLVIVAGGVAGRRDPAQPDPVLIAALLDGRTSAAGWSRWAGSDHAGFWEGAKHELPLGRVFKLTREVAGDGGSA